MESIESGAVEPPADRRRHRRRQRHGGDAARGRRPCPVLGDDGRREPVARTGGEGGDEDRVLELADPREGAAELARVRLGTSHDAGHERQQAEPDAHRASVPLLTVP